MDKMNNFAQINKRVGLGILLGALLLVSAACGASSTSSGGNTAVEAAVATMPSASFTAVANQSVLTATVAITSAATTTTTEVVAVESSPDLERGARSYVKNECGACHGEEGEGVADKGGAITGSTLTLQEFDTLLRTGNGLGAEHIFGPSAVSPGGVTTLHAYVQSLGK